MDTYQYNQLIEQLRIISMQLNQLNETLTEEITEDEQDDTTNQQDKTTAKQ